jgi:hypothetical protein
VSSSVATASEPNEPIEYNSNSGIETYGSSGSFNILPDAEVSEPRPLQSLEFWIKFNNTINSKYVFDARPGGGTQYLWVNGTGLLGFLGGTVYVNGAAVTNNTYSPLANKWYHMVFVFTAPINTAILIPSFGDRQIGILNVYGNALTAAECGLAYQLYFGYPSASLATESIDVEETATPFKMYGYSWSISPTG